MAAVPLGHEPRPASGTRLPPSAPGVTSFVHPASASASAATNAIRWVIPHPFSDDVHDTCLNTLAHSGLRLVNAAGRRGGPTGTERFADCVGFGRRLRVEL